jgi:hypothetical protein
MKVNKSILWSLVLMIVVAALYRVIPGRPYGFAPQLALALFSGAIIKDKRMAFVLPLLSMFISDLIYQGLYSAGLSPIWGFYPGQWLDYLAYASVTVFGFFIKRMAIVNILLVSLAAPTYFFIVSNFLTWTGLNGYDMYPKTGAGLVQCYVAALPFYLNSLIGTVVFSGVLFASWHLISRRAEKPVVTA